MRINTELGAVDYLFAVYDSSNHFPEIEGMGYRKKIFKRPSGPYDIERIFLFQQTWSDTGCGFGGIRGQAITNAFTVVLQLSDNQTAVYINKSFAYYIKNPNNKFKEDLKNFNLRGKTSSRAGNFYEK